jgi:hypothetical protein
VHVYNSSYSGAGGRKIMSLRPALAKCLSQKQNTKKRGRGIAQVVEPLSSMHRPWAQYLLLQEKNRLLKRWGLNPERGTEFLAWEARKWRIVDELLNSHQWRWKKKEGWWLAVQVLLEVPAHEFSSWSWLTGPLVNAVCFSPATLSEKAQGLTDADRWH